MTRHGFPILFLLICLCFPAPVQARDNLTIAMTQFPSTFHPGIDSMLAKTYVLGLTRRPLTIYDPDWQLNCMLCTELPSFENGRVHIETRNNDTKALAVRYTIQPDARWGDGTAVTTDDVLFAWEVGKHLQVGISNFELYAQDIVDITAHDDKNFTVHFDKVFCDVGGLNDFQLLPAHLERAVFEKDPATYRNRSLYDHQPQNPGLYYGPYILTAVDPGASIQLAQNPYWWGKKPAFKTLNIRVIENTTTLGASLLSGDIDFIAGELGMLTDQAIGFEKRLKKKRPGQYNVIYKPGLVYEHIDLNFENPKLQDRRVRQALLHALNRQDIATYLFQDKQPVAHSGIHPLDSIYSDEITKYPYDPEKAAQLLDAAGWHLKNGTRTNSKGETLSLVLMTTAGDHTREMVQQILQADWRKIGVDVTIKNEPARVFFGQTVRERKYDSLAMFAWLSAPKSIPRTTLHSTMITTPENGFAGQNYTAFQNPEMDQILDDLETVCTPDKNRQLWNRLQQLYTQELPALPLYYRAQAFFVPEWLEGIVPTGHQYPTSFWVEHWTVK